MRLRCGPLVWFVGPHNSRYDIIWAPLVPKGDFLCIGDGGTYGGAKSHSAMPTRDRAQYQKESVRRVNRPVAKALWGVGGRKTENSTRGGFVFFRLFPDSVAFGIVAAVYIGLSGE